MVTEARDGEPAHLTRIYLVEGSDLGWQVAARREAEADGFAARLARVGEIIGTLNRDSSDRDLVLALDRIADVAGVPHFEAAQFGGTSHG